MVRAAVRLAAAALNLGWADPLDLLALAPGDLHAAAAVIREAQKQRDERDRQLAELSARLHRR